MRLFVLAIAYWIYLAKTKTSWGDISMIECGAQYIQMQTTPILYSTQGLAIFFLHKKPQQSQEVKQSLAYLYVI